METLKKDTTFNSKFLIGLFSVVALAASIYLTQHFYKVHFPTTIGEGGLCDISSFLNCDAATNSPLSNLFGTPISAFGILTSLLFLAPLILSAVNFSGAILFFGGLNLLGCVSLLIYSLISLGSLCPVCSIFWVSSNIAFYLYYKNLRSRSLTPLPITIVALVYLGTTGLGHLTYASKEKDILAIKDSLISQYESLETLTLPKKLPDLNLTEESKEDSPVTMVVFSDFQCPACKALSKMLPSVMRKYKNKIEIKYLFYPLDSACNSKMTYALHPQACNAAKIALCKKSDLLRVHDEIFEEQKDIDDEWINAKVIKESVKDCYGKEETLKELISIVDLGNEIGVKSTPTFLLNNKKIEGVLPLNQLYILIDHLIKK